ncbi:MAG: single-stranded-DNA-specific exonuclease RecJ [Oligoflexia bacterium]|nr:single-stranded-DNA-specific exonuclease RecJ [Oligoflexia bacterium]
MHQAAVENREFAPVETAHRKIRLRKQLVKQADAIAQEYSLSAVASRVLAARGHTVGEDLQNYLSPTLKDGLPDPNKLKNLALACRLIKEVADTGKGIAICCDFDVDGLSGGAQVHDFFNQIGVQSQVFVPDRFEDGYGLNEKMVREIAEKKFGLLLTIDYGTTNVKELELAHKLGLKSVVVDHHHVSGQKPPADFFINPNQKGCGFAGKILCASGLAWYLLVALKGFFPQAKQLDVKNYLDLACLGTICDMVPLIGANRVIAKRGLELLGQTTRPGLVALKNVSGINQTVNCFDVGFGIGPRLNAAGRIVHGDIVVQLLTTSDSKLATKLAQRLNKLNLERQHTEGLVKEAAVERIRSRGHLPAGLVVYDKEFHTGVVGIVAQRLVEMFYRPAVVLGRDSDGLYKGSVRGIRGFNVVEALGAVSEHLVKFGGHEGAGGLSVQEANFEAFEEAFVRECERRLSDIETDPVAEADTEASLSDLHPDLISELKRFAPFGIGNPNPQLLFRGLKVAEVRSLKDAHLKVTFSDGKAGVTGLMWRTKSHPALKVGAQVDVVGRPDMSNFGGRSELQLNLQAVESA